MYMQPKYSSKPRWIRFVEPEVGVVVMECEACGHALCTLDPPDRCPACRREMGDVVREEEVGL